MQPRPPHARSFAAVAYIPATHDRDLSLPCRLIAYGKRQGYGLLAIVLQWTAVRHLLDARAANLVVYPPGEYGQPAADDEITQPINRPAHHNRDASTARFPPATIRAVIYLPDGSTIDGDFAQTCLAHIQNRGYELVGIVHTRTQIGQLFRSGGADVAVLARREHWNPAWKPRIEVAGEDPGGSAARPTPKANAKNAGPNRDRRPRVLG